jgi:1,4-alpha-glucan branching enzyme
MKSTASTDDIYRIIYNDHHDPFQVLGKHTVELEGKKLIVVRAFLADALSAAVLDSNGTEYAMERIHEAGFFELVAPTNAPIDSYRLRKTTANGSVETFYDSYSFLPTVTDYDLYLFGAGDNRRVYDKLGAHFTTVNSVEGVVFAVWAPNARSVSVIGDFNKWDRRLHAMRTLGASGVWEIFIPGLLEGDLYKFQIKTQNGFILDKTDPYATEMEARPRTASKINFLSGYQWSDEAWLKERSSGNELGKPISVYEVHLGSWMRHTYQGNKWYTYRELAESLIPYVTQRGFTHIELLPIMEHPFDGSWGYQVTGYYAPTSRFGTPDDFMFFVDQCHANGIAVLLDWVPAHFPKDAHALADFDGTHLYEHSDPRKGEHQDWGTYIFNFGRNEVKNFLIGNALFWIDKYHLDGLRIDAVASMLYLDYSRKAGEWLPNQYGGRENLEAIEFLKHLNSLVRKHHPGVLMIAEESTSYPKVSDDLEYGGLGFSMKWNMGWMHDTLEYFSKDSVYRGYHHKNLTFALLYAFSERFMLPLSHDEVVHGKRSLLSKMPGDEWQQFANLRALFGLMFGFPGKKLMFMGDEFGQRAEWNHDRQLDWHVLQYPFHAGVQKWVDDLNRFYKNEPALHQLDFHHTGFEWIDFEDASGSTIAFLRKSADDRSSIVVVCNFTPVPRSNYRLGVPEEGAYEELLNSDSNFYGGSNLGNSGALHTESIPHYHRPFSVLLTLPPLAVLFLKKK